MALKHQRECKHEWVLIIGTAVTQDVGCKKCYAHFKPMSQVVPYRGIVPAEFSPR